MIIIFKMKIKYTCMQMKNFPYKYVNVILPVQKFALLKTTANLSGAIFRYPTGKFQALLQLLPIPGTISNVHLSVWNSCKSCSISKQERN